MNEESELDHLMHIRTQLQLNMEAISRVENKIDTVVEAVEGALKGLQNNPMLRAIVGGK